ncbi:hypothetical protein [Amycolatopsis sp. NPDC004079]|uniref:hypothetical protein n=1 Tax=Amycolatopsis sp. NPDC004079 TaxID=3154549 RepID=UPI0033BA354D
MVRSAREQYVTDMVTEWLVNDGPVRAEAVRIVARSGKTAAHDLGVWLWRHLREARRGTAAWHLAQELAENDYLRVSWGEVARSVQEG